MPNARAKMVDISKKQASLRQATAQARIVLEPRTTKLIKDNKIPKGDVFTIAKCAGILAAKRVDELIPLCHPLPLEEVEVNLILQDNGIVINARCKTTAKTGVEMEAMVAATIAALTIYDMCKFTERAAVIQEVKLLEKKGGKSGHYKRK